MKKYIAMILSIMSILSLAACGKSDSYEIEIVLPTGSQELKSADQMEVPMKNMVASLESQVGDTIEISYNGEIQESYPARLNEVYNIKVTEEAEQWDLIPMVMVNGELYLDTGFESTLEARCGVMDGQITSAVESWEKPTENNQSNFGTGYGYQYGSTKGTIEIFINEKWWIYATEEVRQELQFPTEESDCVIPNSVKNIIYDEVGELSDEDAEELFNILETGVWNHEGTADCSHNCEITIQEQTFCYHSDCGTFNDNVNHKSFSLNEETKILVNNILKKYITLDSVEVPME